MSSFDNGTGHKVEHNLTTILNIPLVAWLIYSVFMLRDADYATFDAYLSMPFNMLAAILFILVSLRHFALEVEVVLEDYVACACKRRFSVTLLKLTLFVFAILGILSVLKIGLS